MKTTALLFAVLALAVGVAASVAATPGKFVVASTLDGKTILPRHIHWYANPRGARVREVDFLVDGIVRWKQHSPPYIYGDEADDFGKVDRGYLVTSWLAPGRHRFVVRVTSTDGRRATDTVSARVLPAPDPPAALGGVWTRVVDPAGAPTPGSPGAPVDTPTPAGTYTLVIEKRWIQTRNPGTFTHASVDRNTGLGYVQDTDYVAGPQTFRVWGAVSFRPFTDYVAEEGTWCLPWGGPRADYTWAVSGDTLTLSPVGGHEPCRVREFIWAGDWTRSG